MADQVARKIGTTRRPGEFTGWHMLALMLLFFGVIVSVNITMAVMAGRTWTGLVVKNSYVESQKFNGYLAAAKAQDARGWSTDLSYNNGVIVFDVVDRDGHPVTLTEASLFVGRPAFEQADQTVELTTTKPGRYIATIDLAPGAWALRITGTSDGHPYRRDSRLNVLPSGVSGREDRG
ncbi:MAG: FixH family protein [Pseudomonadota bacterium]